MEVATSPPAAAVRPDRPRLSPAVAFLLAIWLGLCAGYLDVGVIAVKKFCLNKEGAFRSARDFPWTVPVSHVVLALVPAALLAVVGARGSRRLSLRAGSWLLATLVFWGALLRLPFYGASTLALAFGLARLFADAAAKSGFSLRVGWVRNSLAGFVGLLLILIAATTGRQMLRESRAVAGLPAPPPSARNVVFIVWDTVRASSLSLYGASHWTTPQLAKWAERGVSFERPLAPSSWTYPSHACFFTGQWPFKINSQWKFSLDTPDPTLAEFLAARGYQTAGFVANTNCCNYETGLDRGFLHFEDYTLTPRSLLSRTVPGRWFLEQILIYIDPYERKWVSLQSRGAGAINEAFLGWLERRRSERPFFAFLNYFDAHEPYIPPAGSERFGIRPSGPRDYQFLVDYVGLDKEKMQHRDFMMARDCYDDCIGFLDEQLDRLLSELERRNMLENTVVIITADHGEGLGEHGFTGHSYSVEIQEVGVPLVILSPGTPAGRTVQGAVSLRDLPATIADLVGLAKNSPFPGRSLAEYWRLPSGQPSAQLASPALSEHADEALFQSPPGEGRRNFEFSLVTPDGHQYIRSGRGEELLYNLWGDPLAIINLIKPPHGDAMAERFRKLLLDALNENRGSVEVEDTYLKAFRQQLAELVKGSEARKVAIRRP